MSKNNDIINDKLIKAQFCLAVLESKGLDVDAVNIDDRKPVLTIVTHLNQPIAEVEGITKKTFQKGGRNWRTYTAELEDCQVEWTVQDIRKTA
jgi:hypothetical protein